MFFTWLKQYMPRSLYGRAAAILILPVIVLQLVVSLAFIQRYYEEISRQMSSAMALELGMIVAAVDGGEDLAAGRAAGLALSEPLQINLTLPAAPWAGQHPGWFSLSARTVEDTLRQELPGLHGADFNNFRRVSVWVETRFGPAILEFSRRRVSASNPHQLLVIGLFTATLMTLIAYFFLRNQLRPIKRMARAAAEYGKGRIVEFAPSGAVEVRAAGNAFLDMRNRIERQSQSRTLMLSGVSHDLRTPLTRLRLGLSLLENSEEAGPMIRDVDDMSRLVDTFLDYAKADAAEDPQQVDPVALVKQIVADAGRAGQAVAIGAIVGAGATMELRPIAVRRALENLIANAVRFGTQARVSLTLRERSLCISVEDDGPGIAADQREEALRAFAQLDPARNQDKGAGVGLGLAIVADVARVHGGTLRLSDSADLGGLQADLVLAR